MSDLRRGWAAVVVVSVVALCALARPPAEAACGPAIYVEILSPNPDVVLRGYDVNVSVHAWTTGALKVKSIVVFYDGHMKWKHGYNPAVQEKYDSDTICTFEEANDPSGVLMARASADDGVRWAEDSQINPVDNAYLISATRGTCASPGTVTWKYWSGGGWTALDSYCTGGGHLNTSCSGWRGTTEGGANGYCTGPGQGSPRPWCSHLPNYPDHPPINRCQNGDTPGYTGSGRNYPALASPGYTDYVCDGLFGTAKIWLPDTSADCGCARTEIRIHGDQINGQCPDTHAWNPTIGCVRMQNGAVQTLCNIVAAASGRVGLDDIHISVPNP
jgi:hypothetical protein